MLTIRYEQDLAQAAAPQQHHAKPDRYLTGALAHLVIKSSPGYPRVRGSDGAGSAPSWSARQYRPGPGRHVENTIMSALVWAGLVPRSYLLTTRGRKTGRPRTNPVVPVGHRGRRWLVAPYGAVSWVHNARAAGRVTLTRRRDTREYAIQEAAPEEAGPILKRYVCIATVTRRYFLATKDSPLEDFVAEADRHPVFELVAADGSRRAGPSAR